MSKNYFSTSHPDQIGIPVTFLSLIRFHIQSTFLRIRTNNFYKSSIPTLFPINIKKKIIKKIFQVRPEAQRYKFTKSYAEQINSKLNISSMNLFRRKTTFKDSCILNLCIFQRNETESLLILFPHFLKNPWRRALEKREKFYEVDKN